MIHDTSYAFIRHEIDCNLQLIVWIDIFLILIIYVIEWLCYFTDLNESLLGAK
jgi:hypothetical protein